MSAVAKPPAGADDAGEHRRERERFFGAAKVIAALTLVSRVLGMVRDMAITSLGADRATSAFVLAYRIPNLFRRLFGEGALAGAFVPVFTETAERTGADSARRLLANALGLLAAVLAVILLLLELGLLVWGVFWPGEPDRQLLLALLGIMLPFMVTICLLALGSAALNCRGHFAYPAAAPALLNVMLILAAWWLAPAWRGNDTVGQLYVIAACVTLAGCLQLAGVLWLLRRAGLGGRPRLRPVEPGIRTMLALMAPTVLGLGFPQISSLVEGVVIWLFSGTPQHPTTSLLGQPVAQPLSAGAQVHVYAANQLYQFPMGVLAISLGVAVFPLLSRYAARGDLVNLRAGFNRAVRLAIMEGLVAGVGLFVLAEPVTQLIFQRRNFTPADAHEVAGILRMYVLGMWAYCSYQIFLRTFYALKEPHRPLKVIAAMAVVNMLLMFGLIWVIGARAFGVATAVTMSVATLALAFMLRRRLGLIGGRKIALSVARTLAACGVMAGALVAAQWGMSLLPAWAAGLARPAGAWQAWLVGAVQWLLGAGYNLSVVLVCLPAGAATFLLTAWLLRAPELGELFGSLRRKPTNHPAPAPETK